MTVVVLAGGTGGAKLARGMLDVVGDELVVIANTGDDVDVYGARVSPDPDLVCFHLADRIDARGWGLDGDTFHVMDGLRETGREVWFNLGDRDLAYGIDRAERIAAGQTPTQALDALRASLGISARVLPMTDGEVRTRVMADGRWWEFQEFMIRHRAQGPVQGVALDGADAAAPSAEVRAAIAGARAIVVGPSNPIISIGPILALEGMRELLRDAEAPVVAVSPVVGGEVLKGPTKDFMAWAEKPATAAGVAALYEDFLDGIVCDEEPIGLPVAALQTDTLLSDPGRRRDVARATLDFALGLAGARRR